MLTLIQMRYFYEVCRWRNISKAAANLHISQPTISIAIRDLEKETGLNLFRREGKSLIITEDGQILWNKITPILANLVQLDQEIKNMSNSKNHIRLGIPVQIGVWLMPAVFREFRELHPEIELEIVETGGIDAMRLLEENKLDLAVTNYDNQFSENLRYIKLGDSEICFCTYPENILAHEEKVDFETAAKVPLVLLQGGFFINRIIHSIFQEHKLTPKVDLYSVQLSTVKRMVQHKVASTFLMRQAVVPEDNIIVKSLQPPRFINSGIVMSKKRQIYNDERKLMQFIKEKYKEQNFKNK